MGTGSEGHAQFYHSAFLPIAESPQPTATTAWMAQRGREIDNVRQALDWAFADGGDAAIGVPLTALCAPVWLYLSLLVECRDQAERALAHPGHVETLRPELQIQLYTTLGVTLVYTGGSVQRTAAILTTAEKISRELDDRLPRLQVLWATWILRFLNGELVTARQIVEPLRIKAETFTPDPASAAADSQAERRLRDSIACARAQGALAWELRSARSLVRLMRRRGRPGCRPRGAGASCRALPGGAWHDGALVSEMRSASPADAWPIAASP